jgi:hypothetical protein
MTTYNGYPPQPVWQRGELDASDTQYVREELGGVPYMDTALRELGDGLTVGSSRTLYNLPINLVLRDSLDAMISAASTAAEAIYHEGVEDATRRGTQLVLRVDELPEHFEATALPEGIKASMLPDSPIGYLRTENTEAGLKASVGALDQQTQTHYSTPLN